MLTQAQYTATSFAPDRGRIDGIMIERVTVHHSTARKYAADAVLADAEGDQYRTACCIIRDNAGRFVGAYIAQQQSVGIAVDYAATIDEFDALAKHYCNNVTY